jgi:flagellar protein FliS
MYRSAKEAYQKSLFFTASPAKLVLMCYEGAIGNLKTARDAYAEKDYKSKAKALQKALDILYELNASLNLQRGGVIAANLRALYNYMIRSLLEGDLKKDLTAFDRAVAMLEDLASSWREIATKPVDDNSVSRQQAAKNLGLSVMA